MLVKLYQADYSTVTLRVGDCHGRDCMVVCLTTAYAISDYHHWCCEFESRTERDVQHCDKVC